MYSTSSFSNSLKIKDCPNVMQQVYFYFAILFTCYWQWWYFKILEIIFVYPIRNIWMQCALHFLVLYLPICYHLILFGVVEQKCLNWQPRWSPFMPTWKNPSQLMKRVITYSHPNICLTGALVSSDTLFRYFLKFSNFYCIFLNPNYFLQFELYLF